MDLEARGVRFAYRHGWSLGPVDLVVPGGSITALVGPNGAGKTTLMRILAGLILPGGGTIQIGGTPVAGRAELARKVALTPSEPRFPRGCRVCDLVRLAAPRPGPAGPDPASLQRRVSRTIGRSLHVDPRTLSRGQRLNLAIELALAGPRRAVLLDEPWAGLDPLAVERLFARLQALAEAGTAVLVSSHDLYALPSLAHRYVFLVDGRIRAVGSLDDLQGPDASPEAEPARFLRELYRRLAAGESP